MKEGLVIRRPSSCGRSFLSLVNAVLLLPCSLSSFYGFDVRREVSLAIMEFFLDSLELRLFSA